jgi:hypothetical protein
MRKPYYIETQNSTRYYQVPVWARTPKYWEKKAKRQALPDNNFRADTVEFQHPAKVDPESGKMSSVRDGSHGLFRTVHAAACGAPVFIGDTYRPNEVEALQNAAMTRLASKLRAYPINVGVALGEWRETASFFSDIVSRVVRIYRAARKNNLYEVFKLLKGDERDYQKWLANKWLQYKYAVKPLMLDMYGACEALAEKDLSELWPIKLRTTMRTQVGHSGTWYDHSGQYSADIRVRVRLRARVTNPLLRRLDQSGVLNPALIVWELVPFSFVIDWFIPVGDWLMNVMPPLGVEIQGTMSTRVFGYLNQSYVRKSDSFVLNGSLTELWYDRQKVTRFPTPKLGAVDLSMSMNQLTTAMALLKQVHR